MGRHAWGGIKLNCAGDATQVDKQVSQERWSRTYADKVTMAQDAKGKEVGVAGKGETARGQEQVSLLFDKLLNFVCNRSEIYSIHNFYLTTIQTCWLTIFYKNINDAKKTLKKNEKWCSNARTFSSNFWVLWQPPIGNVTPYFRGLVPYLKTNRTTKH